MTRVPLAGGEAADFCGCLKKVVPGGARKNGDRKKGPREREQFVLHPAQQPPAITRQPFDLCHVRVATSFFHKAGPVWPRCCTQPQKGECDSLLHATQKVAMLEVPELHAFLANSGADSGGWGDGAGKTGFLGCIKPIHVAGLGCVSKPVHEFRTCHCKGGPPQGLACRTTARPSYKRH